MRIAKITGMKEIMGNIKLVTSKVEAGFARGLKQGGLFLQAESQKIVPFQLGKLHGSAFTRNVGGNGFDTDIIVGYTSKYAVFVHEDMNKVHGKAFNVKHAAEIKAARGTHRGTAEGGMFKRGENQQAKFLETPARQKRSHIIRIIRSNIKLGK